MGLLSGKASQWATALSESGSFICDSYPALVNDMRNIFDYPVQGREAGNQLFTLKQCSNSVAKFVVEFRIVESGWGETALQAAFVCSLSEEVKDELAAKDESTNIDSLISLAICLDNHLRERNKERTSSKTHTSLHNSPRNPISSLTNPRFVSFPIPFASPVSTEEPMQLGRL